MIFRTVYDIADTEEVLAVCVQPDHDEYHFIAADQEELAEKMPDPDYPLDQCGECGGSEYTLHPRWVKCNECAVSYPIESAEAHRVIF